MMVHPGSVLGKRVPAAFGKVPALDCPTKQIHYKRTDERNSLYSSNTFSPCCVFFLQSASCAAAERFEVQYLNLCTS